MLSSRQDLLPKPYITELRTLQDAVPPFDDALAKRIIERELGVEVAGRLTLGAAPIASASLGQVYRGVLRVGGGGAAQGVEVAVKVQRPGALAAISLDVGIVRALAEPWRKFKGLNTDLEGLVDEWGRRFVAELDYVSEADNGERFARAMAARRDLAGVVTTAAVRRDATTRRVLTTEWVQGQRLDTSQAGDIPQLCAVALSAYLAMLLDIGVLHADPHPGECGGKVVESVEHRKGRPDVSDHHVSSSGKNSHQAWRTESTNARHAYVGCASACAVINLKFEISYNLIPTRTRPAV